MDSSQQAQVMQANQTYNLGKQVKELSEIVNKHYVENLNKKFEVLNKFVLDITEELIDETSNKTA